MHPRQEESELGNLMSGNNKQRDPIWFFSVLFFKLMGYETDIDNV